MKSGENMKEDKKWYQSFGNWLIIVGCVILIPILAINLWIIVQSKSNNEKVPSVFGYKPFIVLSGSMESDIRKGDLIITNYSEYEITDTTITHAGETVGVSAKAVKDTQICYFTIEPANDYSYTVSFVDHNGEEYSREFTDNFTQDGQILIAIRYTDNAWTIEYDK